MCSSLPYSVKDLVFFLCGFSEMEREKILTPGTEEKTNRALLSFTVTTSFSKGNISAIRVKSKAH